MWWSTARIEWIRPRGCFAISPVPRSLSRKQMWFRCGAQTGFAPTWKKAPAIDKGSPVAFHESQELGRAFRLMTAALVQASGGESPLEIAQQQDPGAKKKAPGRLLISPLRAGQ